MSREIDQATRALNELHELLDLERRCKWWNRWAIRNAIIAKLRYRMGELYSGVESRS